MNSLACAEPKRFLCSYQRRLRILFEEPMMASRTRPISSPSSFEIGARIILGSRPLSYLVAGLLNL
jgi:hypothetical protein